MGKAVRNQQGLIIGRNAWSARYALGLCLGVALGPIVMGCSEYPQQGGKSGSGGANVGAPGGTPSGGVAQPVGAAQTSGGGATQAITTSEDAELVEKVDQLVALTKQYNELAATIQDRETYLQRSDELQAIEEQLEPLVIDVTIATEKMTPEQKSAFDAKHYDTKAKPVIDEKVSHRRRLEGLFR